MYGIDSRSRHTPSLILFRRSTSTSTSNSSNANFHEAAFFGISVWELWASHGRFRVLVACGAGRGLTRKIYSGGVDLGRASSAGGKVSPRASKATMNNLSVLALDASMRVPKSALVASIRAFNAALDALRSRPTASILPPKSVRRLSKRNTIAITILTTTLTALIAVAQSRGGLCPPRARTSRLRVSAIFPDASVMLPMYTFRFSSQMRREQPPKGKENSRMVGRRVDPAREPISGF